MADETAELGLQITGEDLTKGAFNSVNSNIDGVQQHTSKMSVHTLQNVSKMTQGFENFARGISSGNITGAFKGLISMIVMGFRSMGTEMAMATMGISLLIAAIVYVGKKWYDAHKEAEAAAEDQIKKEKELQQLMDDEVKDRQAKEQTAQEKVKDAFVAAERERISAIEDTTKRAIAQANLEASEKVRILEKQIKDLEALQKSGALPERPVEAINALRSAEVNAEKAKQVKIKEIKDKAAKEKKAEERAEAAEEAKKDRALKQTEKEFFDRVDGEIAEEKKAADQRIRNFENQIAYQEALIAGTADMMGAFAGLNQALKGDAMLTKALAISQALINTYLGVTKAYAQGGVLGFITGATVLAAGLAQVANIKAQSFQTPDFGERMVPGPPNAMKLAMVHGGENIGRKGQGGGTTLVIKGDYFESTEANARLYSRMYRHQKRNGLKIQPA